MFTGLIQHVGRVSAMSERPDGRRLTIDAAGWDHRPNCGESIAVNGCCLTVATEGTGGDLHFDVIHRTLEVTAMGALVTGDRVNLERAATPSTMLGGHIVQGHVDGVGIVSRVLRSEVEHRMWFDVPKDLLDCIIETGSIAVSGVSLTVAELTKGGFGVALIPTTLRETNLGERAEGDRVNIEADYLAKTVVHWLRRRELAK